MTGHFLVDQNVYTYAECNVGKCVSLCTTCQFLRGKAINLESFIRGKIPSKVLSNIPTLPIFLARGWFSIDFIHNNVTSTRPLIDKLSH